MTLVLNKLPERGEQPSEETIEQRAMETSRFPALGLSSQKVRDVHYVTEDIRYNARTNTWTYEFLNSSGEWESYEVTEEAIRKRVPAPLVDLEMFLQNGELR